MDYLDGLLNQLCPFPSEEQRVRIVNLGNQLRDARRETGGFVDEWIFDQALFEIMVALQGSRRGTRTWRHQLLQAGFFLERVPLPLQQAAFKDAAKELRAISLPTSRPKNLHHNSLSDIFPQTLFSFTPF
ncbi:hypothetical protein GCK72_025320 [Caenorhabditis remanei]|uniref:Uncharacterized protein n=1 Tax=Caenorhabditis remanei TaxID=31234 RepID=A0A6A5G227_CAERE|nr:hypothetical protein GCK72_025320 [Caenorhabditis remanei]KAF1748853.1 hypothetical protein GCK72_025320 [Caenorhabditis remanei]